MDNSILHAFQPIAELLGWTILHSLWQITLIAVLLKLLLKWTANYDATIRYALAISALFVATFWSAFTFLGALENATFTTTQIVDNGFITDATPAITSEATSFSMDAYLEIIKAKSAQMITPLMPFIAIFWFIGIVFFASRILVGLYRLQHFSNHGIAFLPKVWSTRLLTLKQLTGIQRPIKVRLSQLVESPITYQFFRPIILLPVSLFTHLSDEQIEVLLLHELAHIKRNDYLVNLIQSSIEVLFFYHPLIWWMSKQVRLEREHCCDDRVMNLRHNPMLYAQTLTQIQGQHYSFKTKLAMSATGNKGDFSKRIYRLFIQKEPYATLRNSVAALLLLLFSGGMMAFYPKQSSPINNSEITAIIVQDTLPKAIIAGKEDYKNQKLPLIVIDDKEVIKATSHNHLTLLLKELQEKDHEAVMMMKDKQFTKSYKGLVNEEVIFIYTKNGPKEEERRGYKLHKDLLKKRNTKAVKGASTGSALQETGKNVQHNKVNKKKSFSLKLKDGLLTLKMLKGKEPIVYLDNKVYKKWKMDETGTLVVDIPSKEVHSINVFKREKAIALFGPEASDEVVYIVTKANPNPDVIIEKEKKLQLEAPNKKTLVIVNGKVSQQAVEDINPDDIATMNVLGDVALKKYGAQGYGDVVEIYTKVNTPAEQPAEAKKELKLNGAVGMPKSENKKNEETNIIGTLHNNKKPLFVVDGKKLPKTTSLKTMDILPDDIAVINVLKDESAIEKYGTEGADGVVEIITKANKKALKELEKIKKTKKREKQALLRTKKKEKSEKVKLKEQKVKAKQRTVLSKKKELAGKRKALKTQKQELAEKAFHSAPTGLSVYPNPTRALTNVQLILKRKGQVKVDILNIKGQVVLNLVNEVMGKGVHQFQWNSDNQPAGSYFVHFNLDGSFISKQVVVKK